MTKTTVLKKQPKKQAMSDFDFAELIMGPDSPDEGAVFGMVSGIIEAYSRQQQTALELTKLALEKSSSESMSEEDVFSTFKRASAVVLEACPIKELFEKIND